MAPSRRFSAHRSRAATGKRPHPLYNAMRSRPEAFEFCVLAEVTADALCAVERDMIRLAGTLHPNGYNLLEGGLVEYRKTSASLSGRRRSPEAIEKSRLGQIGKVISVEQRQLLRQINLGKRHSAESKAKTSASLRASEHVKRAAAARVGTKLSDATRAKMRAAHATPECAARVRAPHLGRKVSEATKCKMRETTRRLLEKARAALSNTKACTKCAVSMQRTSEFFYRASTALDGLQSACKRCHRLQSAKYEKNRCRAKLGSASARVS